MPLSAPEISGHGNGWTNMWSLDRLAVIVTLLVQVGLGVGFLNSFNDKINVQGLKQEQILKATEDMKGSILELKIENRVGKEDLAELKSMLLNLAQQVQLNTEFRRANVYKSPPYSGNGD